MRVYLYFIARAFIVFVLMFNSKQMAATKCNKIQTSEINDNGKRTNEKKAREKKINKWFEKEKNTRKNNDSKYSELANASQDGERWMERKADRERESERVQEYNRI